MTWTSNLRRAAFARLPKSWQPVASYHYYRARSHLDRELPIVCRALRPGVRAIDVGANEGVYTHAFARTGARVESFEPQPACIDVLLSYERRHPNVCVHTEALGAHDGGATLRVPLRDGQPVSGWASLSYGPRVSTAATEAAEAMEFVVPVRTIDSFAFDNVEVIKIDVEGGELDVVRGARKTISSCNPMLLVEIEERHLGGGGPIDRVFDEVLAIGDGYRGHFVHPIDGIQPLDAFDAARHQVPANADKPGALYINNFIFTPLDRAVGPQAGL